MKILFLHDKYIKNGGAERCINLERNAFEKKGNKTFLFTTIDIDNEYNDIKSPETTTLFLKNNVFLGSYLNSITVYIKLKNYIKKINPDIIYIHNNYEYPFSFLAACRGYETIQKTHDFGIVCPSRWCVYKDSLKICDGRMGLKCVKHGCVSFKTFLSQFLKINYIKNNKIIKKFISPSKNLYTYMLANGFKKISIEKNPFEIYQGNEKIQRKKNHFLYVGGLFQHKGVFLMMESIKIAAKKNPLIKLKIIGSGPEENNLKNKVKEYDLTNNVCFLGPIKNEYLYKYYKEATATIFPSIWMENDPYVIKESLFFKTPVIAGNIGAAKELINNIEDGRLFKHNDKGDLAKKILEFTN